MATTHSISHSGMALFSVPIQSTIGGLVIDLASELRIETTVGGIEIYLPRHVTFLVNGSPMVGGQDVHDGHGFFNRLGRSLGGLFGWHSSIPDTAVPSPDPSKPTMIRISVDAGIGGIDIYRI
jgi:hypothetical protein